MCIHKCSSRYTGSAAHGFILYTPFVSAYINSIFVNRLGKIHIDTFLFKLFAVANFTARFHNIYIHHIICKFYKVRRTGIQYGVARMMINTVYIHHFQPYHTLHINICFMCSVNGCKMISYFIHALVFGKFYQAPAAITTHAALVSIGIKINHFKIQFGMVVQ